jgi:hypothetical protein
MPSTPGPTPTTTPEPASLGFLHVLQGSSVVTYAVDRFTGTLRQSAAQDVGDAHTLTGEPQGRYVFAAFGPRGGPPYFDPSIVAYVPDPTNGSLSILSEASSDPVWCPCCSPVGRGGGWYWLSASATRVYGMWGTTTYHDWYPAYVTHAVADDGQLGPAYVRDLGEWDYGRVTVDVESNVLYKQGDTRLTAHFVEPDGSLTQMGASNLCVAMEVDYAKPVVAARGFVFALASPLGYSESTICSWEGARLAPRANLGVYTHYAVALALGAGASFHLSSRPAALVAMRTSYDVKRGNHYQTKYEVRLFAMSEDGHVEHLDTVEPGYARHLLFHPSGRFLYVSQAAYESAVSPEKLIIYSISPQGRLEAGQTLEGGGGAMAVTRPPQVRASASVSPLSNPPGQ